MCGVVGGTEVRLSVKVTRRRVGGEAHRVQFEMNGNCFGFGQGRFGDNGHACAAILRDEIKFDIFNRERRRGFQRLADFAALVAAAVGGQRDSQEHHLAGGDHDSRADRVRLQPIGGAAKLVHALGAARVITTHRSKRVPGAKAAM